MSRYPFPIPVGWYLLAPADEIAGLPPQGTTRTRFGHEVLVRRGPAGDLTVCAVGGDRAWPVVERGGFAFAWHHPEAVEPTWDLPDLAPFDEPATDGTIEAETRVEVAACLQEITENGYDEAHLAHVHGTTADHQLTFTDLGDHRSHLQAVIRYDTARGPMEQVIDNRSFGPGFGIVHFAGIVDTWFLAMGTPITAERTAVCFAYRFRAPDGGPADRRAVRAYLAEIERQYRQDTVLWEHKAYLARPALTEGEAVIGRFRRWYRQFYVPAVDGAGEDGQTVWPPPPPQRSTGGTGLPDAGGTRILPG